MHNHVLHIPNCVHVYIMLSILKKVFHCTETCRFVLQFKKIKQPVHSSSRVRFTTLCEFTTFNKNHLLGTHIATFRVKHEKIHIL